MFWFTVDSGDRIRKEGASLFWLFRGVPVFSAR